MTDTAPLNDKCPENKGGGRHHITTKAGKGGIISSCLTCKKTSAQIIDEARAVEEFKLVEPQ